MHLYELINPSDPITFYAPDDAIARAVALLLGRGMYGLCDTDDNNRDVPCLLLFQSKDVVERRLQEWLGKPLSEYMKEHRSSVVDALRTVATVNARERFMYQRALANITNPAERAKFLREVDDHNRSSLNAITACAWKMADALAKPQENKRNPKGKQRSRRRSKRHE